MEEGARSKCACRAKKCQVGAKRGVFPLKRCSRAAGALAKLSREKQEKKSPHFLEISYKSYEYWGILMGWPLHAAREGQPCSSVYQPCNVRGFVVFGGLKWPNFTKIHAFGSFWCPARNRPMCHPPGHTQDPIPHTGWLYSGDIRTTLVPGSKAPVLYAFHFGGALSSSVLGARNGYMRLWR